MQKMMDDWFFFCPHEGEEKEEFNEEDGGPCMSMVLVFLFPNGLSMSSL